MKYIMRQSRDGAIELVDRSPAPTKDRDLMSAISRLGWETVLIWYMRTLAWVWAASPILSPRAAAIGYGGASLNVVLVVGYFLLSWRAARERA
jgi:hypothetical protein